MININTSEISEYNIFGVNYAAVDYEKATEIIIERAELKQSFGVSALAVHGLISSYVDTKLKNSVNKIDLVVPDGQPIRWVINNIYKINLRDRVYGPTLTLYVLNEANSKKLGVYLFGSTTNTITKFVEYIRRNFVDIKICGFQADRFRDATTEEDVEDIDKINNSGAHIVLVGRGCPRQEIWVSTHLGKINAVMMAVGAAFDFHAGVIKQAPRWIQDAGLEWLFRLIQEPKRLWKRYLFTNSYFIYLFLRQKFLMHKGS